TEMLARTVISPPRIPVYSNTIAEVYPHESRSVVELLSEHLIRPVHWVGEIEAMYRDGVRIFVEVGSRNVLTNLVGRILGHRPHVAVALDQPGRPGAAQLLHGLATLVSEGRSFDAEVLFGGRSVRRLDLAALARDSEEPLSPTAWRVDGG